MKIEDVNVLDGIDFFEGWILPNGHIYVKDRICSHEDFLEDVNKGENAKYTIVTAFEEGLLYFSFVMFTDNNVFSIITPKSITNELLRTLAIAINKLKRSKELVGQLVSLGISFPLGKDDYGFDEMCKEILNDIQKYMSKLEENKTLDNETFNILSELNKLKIAVDRQYQVMRRKLSIDRDVEL